MAYYISSSSGANPSLGHGCPNESAPSSPILRSVPGGETANVGWFQVSLNSAGPCVRRSPSSPPPVPWLAMNGSVQSFPIFLHLSYNMFCPADFLHSSPSTHFKSLKSFYILFPHYSYNAQNWQNVNTLYSLANSVCSLVINTCMLLTRYNN